jgi:putative toxin-antitoxin system antitoxin component (TIGR02293 family)
MPSTAAPASIELVHELGRQLELSPKQVGELLGIHPRTLQRRQESGTLEEAELLKGQMLRQTLELATTVFHDTAKARAWLFSPLAALDFERPVDALKTLDGYERVRGLLGQIAFGVY